MLKKIIFFLVNKILYKITTNILLSGKCSHKHTDTKSNQKYIMSTQDIAIAIGDIKNIFVENIFTPFARYTLRNHRTQTRQFARFVPDTNNKISRIIPVHLQHTKLIILRSFLLDLQLVLSLSRVGLSN